jgi:hypothetical protein
MFVVLVLLRGCMNRCSFVLETIVHTTRCCCIHSFRDILPFIHY